MRQYSKRELTSDALIEASRLEPIIYHYLQHWRKGDLPWEQMLIGVALTLSEQKAHLNEMLLENIKHGFPRIIIDANQIPKELMPKELMLIEIGRKYLFTSHEKKEEKVTIVALRLDENNTVLIECVNDKGDKYCGTEKLFREKAVLDNRSQE